ncbi:hypothetical protein D3C81_1761810 [compost metagenome]
MIGASGRHRMKDIGDGDDFGVGIDLLFFQPQRIPSPVIPLMMLERCQRDMGVRPCSFLEHFIAQNGMLLHQLKFIRGQLARFIQNFSRNLQLADIMKRCSQ